MLRRKLFSGIVDGLIYLTALVAIGWIQEFLAPPLNPDPTSCVEEECLDAWCFRCVGQEDIVVVRQPVLGSFSLIMAFWPFWIFIALLASGFQMSNWSASIGQKIAGLKLINADGGRACYAEILKLNITKLVTIILACYFLELGTGKGDAVSSAVFLAFTFFAVANMFIERNIYHKFAGTKIIKI